MSQESKIFLSLLSITVSSAGQGGELYILSLVQLRTDRTPLVCAWHPARVNPLQLKRTSAKVLEFRRADFDLFKDLFGRVPQDRALEGRGTQECWLMFKDHLLQDKERCIPIRRKSGKNARMPPWMDKELLKKLKGKKRSLQKVEMRTGGLGGIQ